MFTIKITEHDGVPHGSDATPGDDALVRFQQTVDTLDLRKVINAVNSKPRGRPAKAVTAQKPMPLT